MLTIYNNLTRQKELFQPINANDVGMYVCGVTTYDYCHIGHGRTFVAFDVMVRYLRFRGFKVNFVRNITDIDDKIITRANQNDEPFNELTARFIGKMHEDFDALGILRPDFEPRATDHISEIIALIEQLIANGAAYEVNGDVYYRVSQFDDYCCLSKQDVEQLRSGARVGIDESKEDSLDFALWKSAKPNEPTWDSPWGKGRPGWHIECSAMSMKALGKTFDIHGGGSDLQFPHHENEIAQSEAATGQRYANTWIHTGMVQVDKEKMSKSLDNFFTIREVLEQYDAEAVRYFLLTAHYRSQLNYSTDNLDAAVNSMARLYTALRDVTAADECTEVGIEHEARFINAMDDDFNAPEALPVLFELAKLINQHKASDSKLAGEYAARLLRLANPLGILQSAPEAWLKSSKQGTKQGGEQEGALTDEQIEAMILERNQARADKDWAKADELRDQFAEAGIILEDAAGKTTWRRS